MNTELFQLFDNGRDWLQQGRCSSVRPLVDQIVSLMTVPLVQGALRSAYKNSQAGTDMATPKSAAEGATFSAAVLPLVHRCNAASAAVVSDNLKFGLFPRVAARPTPRATPTSPRSSRRSRTCTRASASRARRWAA